MHTERRGNIWVQGVTLALLLLWSRNAAAMTQQPVTPAAMTAEVARMAAQAQTVFVGQIVGIARRDQVVEVSFRVEQKLRGVRVDGQTSSGAAQIFVLREWAGMWPPGHQRYVLGQRVLAFLHGASASGFASPVHGTEGLLPVLVQGADRPMLVDLGRVAACVQRAAQAPLPAAGAAVFPLAPVLDVVAANAPAGLLRGVGNRLPSGLVPTNGMIRSIERANNGLLASPVQGQAVVHAKR